MVGYGGMMTMRYAKNIIGGSMRTRKHYESMLESNPGTTRKEGIMTRKGHDYYMES